MRRLHVAEALAYRRGGLDGEPSAFAPGRVGAYAG